MFLLTALLAGIFLEGLRIVSVGLLLHVPASTLLQSTATERDNAFAQTDLKTPKGFVMSRLLLGGGGLFSSGVLALLSRTSRATPHGLNFVSGLFFEAEHLQSLVEAKNNALNELRM